MQLSPWSCVRPLPSPLFQYVLRRACLAPDDPARHSITIADINSLLDRMAAPDAERKVQVGTGIVPATNNAECRQYCTGDPPGKLAHVRVGGGGKGGLIGHCCALLPRNPWPPGITQKRLFGAVWLRPLISLDVPFGAGACTLDSRRCIRCGEYRSAVKVSTCNNPPKKRSSVPTFPWPCVPVCYRHPCFAS
jgi:hypothetical protein